MHFRLRRRQQFRIGAACLAAACGAVVCVAPALAAQEPGPAVFDSIGTQALANARAPGFSLAIVRYGRIVYARGFGIADLARNTPVAANTRFAIGSLSKEFAAAAILRLVERDSLSLDAHLADFLPAMPNARQITLRELLNQTSGLHNFPRTDEHDWPLRDARSSRRCTCARAAPATPRRLARPHPIRAPARSRRSSR
ncbi:MAG TPA: serine hydrolase domain-containing protein [Gemmatimonadaceae bacterium]|nr:serine hydrolase domain-containing protein [Gemmatimonadaceae bacterium]